MANNFNYFTSLSEIANAYKTGNKHDSLCFIANGVNDVALLSQVSESEDTNDNVNE